VEYRMHAETTNSLKPLEKTAGIWKNRRIDGLTYVENLREEWDR
jgi:hypothetical protein